MNNKNELEKLIEKEKEYDDLFKQFLNSDEEATFSKNEVKKIIEAHIFKEVLGNYEPSDGKRKKKNLLVTSKEISARIFNMRFLMNFLITYLFYIGFLLIINEFIYHNLFNYKSTVFIIGLGFTVIDRLIKPFLFVVDLISLTFHKIGIISLILYTVIFYFSSFYLDEKISFEKSIIIATFVLLGVSIIEYLKRDTLFKTKYIEDDFEIDGSEEDD